MIISYNGLIANYHKGFTKNSKLVVWAGGMPVLPKDSDDKDFAAFFAGGRDVVLPEYYGSFRSSGKFSLEGCFQTIIDTHKHFQGGNVISIYDKQALSVQYDTIVLLGSSFGGYFASRIASQLGISAVGLLYPMLTSMENALGFAEETNDDVNFQLTQGGRSNLYRLPSGKRQDFSIQLETDYPAKLLQNTPVFLAHGALDTCIHVSRSQNFYKELDSLTHSDYNLYIELAKGNHGSSVKVAMLPEFVKRLNKIIL